MCQNKKMHPLTYRILKWVSETMYRDIEQIVRHDLQKYITLEVGDNLWNQKLTQFDIEYDQFC